MSRTGPLSPATTIRPTRASNQPGLLPCRSAPPSPARQLASETCAANRPRQLAASTSRFMPGTARLLLARRIRSSRHSPFAATGHWRVAALRQRKCPHADVANRAFAALRQGSGGPHGARGLWPRIGDAMNMKLAATRQRDPHMRIFYSRPFSGAKSPSNMMNPERLMLVCHRCFPCLKYYYAQNIVIMARSAYNP